MKMWQVGPKSWQVGAHGRPSLGKSVAFSGFFPENSTTSLPGKSIYRGFSGRAARKTRLSPATAAPTALRPRATCLSCHSGICQGFFFVTGCRLVGSAIFERPKRWCGRIRGRGQLLDTKSPVLHEVGAVEREKDTEARVSFSCLERLTIHNVNPGLGDREASQSRLRFSRPLAGCDPKGPQALLGAAPFPLGRTHTGYRARPPR